MSLIDDSILSYFCEGSIFEIEIKLFLFALFLNCIIQLFVAFVKKR